MSPLFYDPWLESSSNSFMRINLALYLDQMQCKVIINILESSRKLNDNAFDIKFIFLIYIENIQKTYQTYLKTALNN